MCWWSSHSLPASVNVHNRTIETNRQCTLQSQLRSLCWARVSQICHRDCSGNEPACTVQRSPLLPMSPQAVPHKPASHLICAGHRCSGIKGHKCASRPQWRSTADVMVLCRCCGRGCTPGQRREDVCANRATRGNQRVLEGQLAAGVQTRLAPRPLASIGLLIAVHR